MKRFLIALGAMVLIAMMLFGSSSRGFSVSEGNLSVDLVNITDMANYVAKTPWSMEKNCVWHTNELVNLLHKAGYEAYEKNVQVKCSLDDSQCLSYEGHHMITRVVIYIESTTGELIQPADYGYYGL